MNAKFFDKVFRIFFILAFVLGTTGMPKEIVKAQDSSWENKSPMPTARKWFGGTAIGDKFYAVGGVSDAWGLTFLDTLEVYDPVADMWELKTPMPTPRNRVEVAELDGLLYVVGGRKYDPGYSEGVAVGTLEVYDPATDSWITKTSMPTPRSWAVLGAVDGKIYAMGGFDDQTSQNVAIVEMYDPATDAWTTKAPMPVVMRQHSATVVNGKIYIIGGYAPNVYMYDPVSDTWTTKALLPGTGRFTDAGTVAVGDKIYIIGGYDWLTGVEFDEVWAYDTATDSWESLTALPNSRRYIQAGVIDGVIYAVGGTSGSNIYNSEIVPTGVNEALDMNIPEPIPAIAAYPPDIILGGSWPLGVPVTLTIDNPENGVGVDYSDVIDPITYPWIEFRLNEFDLLPGYLVTLSNGVTTKTLIVSGFKVTVADPEHDTVSGTGIPGDSIQVWVDNVSPWPERNTIVGPDGNWSVDFSVINNPWEVTANLIPGSMGQAKDTEDDNDGDVTMQGWRIHNPSFGAHFRLDGNQVHAYDWPVGESLTLTIDDPALPEERDYLEVQTVSDNSMLYGTTWTVFTLDGFELKPGQIITMTDGTTTKTHEVRTVKVTSVDPGTDTVSGTAEPNSPVGLNAHYQPGGDWVGRSFYADQNGNWSVNLSIPGPNPGEERTYDIQPGSWGTAHQNDNDNDTTFYEWRVPEPVSAFITAYPAENVVNGEDFQQGEVVTLTIDNPSNGVGIDLTLQGVVDQTGGRCTGWCVEFNLPEWFQLASGQLITMSGSNSGTVSYTVSGLTVENVDILMDTVSGKAAPLSIVDVVLWFIDAQRRVTADTEGNWSANFSSPGADPFDTGVCDFGVDSNCAGMALQADGDTLQPHGGGRTRVDWNAPVPAIAVHPVDGIVFAHGWPAGATITLTVDDPQNGTGIDYTFTDQNDHQEWGMWGSDVAVFEIGTQVGSFFGKTLSATNGSISVTYTVKRLTIDSIDPEIDTISGTADPGAIVGINTWAPFFVVRNVVADSIGNWTVDFSVPGSTPEEQQTVDFSWGDNGRAFVADGNNVTRIEWWVPLPPTMDVYPYRFGDGVSNEVFGNDWPVGAAIKVQIDDPKINGTGWDYTDTLTAQAGVNCFAGNQLCFQPDPNVFKILPGQLIRMTDVTHNTFKEHVVTKLNILTLDFTEDTISGSASLGWHYFLTVFSEDGCNTGRWVTADMINGDWSADFGHSGSNSGEEQTCDFKEGVFRLFIPEDTDADGDATKLWTGGPFTGGSIIASPPSGVNGENWPLGEEVKMTIHIPDDDPDNDKIAIGLPEQSEWDHFQSWIHFDLGSFELRPGYEVTFESQSYIKTHEVLDLAVISIDVEHDIISGIADAGAKIEVWEDNTTIRRITTAIGGNWSVDFSDPDNGEGGQGQPIFDIKPWTSGTVKAYISDGDSSTQISWFAPVPECQPGDSVSGTVFESDGITPLPSANIQIEDFITGEPLFVTSIDQNGQYACLLPDGEYRILATATNYAGEYYLETDLPENASVLHMYPGAQLTGINFTLTESFAIEHFTFNLSNPLLQDIAVRQAIALGTDRQRILNEAFLPNGIYGMVSNSIVGPGHWAAAPDSELTVYPYDPAQARAILEAAGWIDRDSDGYRENSAGEELTFNFKTVNRPFRMASGAIFTENMATIGIRINAVYYPNLSGPNGFLDQSDFDIVEFAWGGTVDDATPLNVYISTDLQNYSGYSNPSFDTAMANASAAPSNAEKLPYLIEAQKLLSQDLPILPLFTRYSVNPVSVPTGSDITVSLESYLTVHFDQVETAGQTAVISTDSSTFSLPQNFQLLGKVYDIGSNVQFTNAQVCFSYDDTDLLPAQESAIRLFHLENNSWTDVTDSDNPDTANNKVCGTVTSFSPFAVMYANDIMPPVITWVGSINDGDSFHFGFVPPAPTCTAVDDISGVDGVCTVTGYATTVGTHTLIAMAKDKAGNQATETRFYTISPWTLQGFYQPVDMNSVYNTVKNGSTVPLKFEIFAGNTELTDVAKVKSLTYAQISCDATATTDEIETIATGDTSLRYADGQFIYNWKTPNTAGTCYRVTMTTLDGSSLASYFKLK